MPATFTRIDGEWGVRAPKSVIDEALSTGDPLIVARRDGGFSAVFCGTRVDATTAFVERSHSLRHPPAYIRRMDGVPRDVELPVGRKQDLIFEDGAWGIRYR